MPLEAPVTEHLDKVADAAYRCISVLIINVEIGEKYLTPINQQMVQ